MRWRLLRHRLLMVEVRLCVESGDTRGCRSLLIITLVSTRICARRRTSSQYLPRTGDHVLNSFGIIFAQIDPVAMHLLEGVPECAIEEL